MSTAVAEQFGTRLRTWRNRRRLSQLELANRAAVSTRHLSFLETGRAHPSREMVEHLAEQLDVPLRERNELLEAAGFAPRFRQRSLDHIQMQPVRAALEQVLAAHQPNPAVVVDGSWNLVSANSAALLFMEGAAPHLLEPPVNVIRASLHPDGLARVVTNFDEFATHVVSRLRRQAERSADPGLLELLDEVSDYVPAVDTEPDVHDQVVLPMQLLIDGEQLSFFSTISLFGAPLDITLEELAIEAFYPVDDVTARVLARRAA